MLISVSQGRVVRAVCVITWRGAGAATHRPVRAEVLATHHLVAHEGREGVQTLPGAARGVRGLGEGVQERCNRGQAASLLRRAHTQISHDVFKRRISLRRQCRGWCDF